jgi:hypothetical protein
LFPTRGGVALSASSAAKSASVMAEVQGVVSVLLVISRMPVASTFAACLSAFTYVSFRYRTSVCQSISAHTSAAVAVLVSSASSNWAPASPLAFLFFARGAWTRTEESVLRRFLYQLAPRFSWEAVELLPARVRLLRTSGGDPKSPQGQGQIFVVASAHDFLRLLFINFFRFLFCYSSLVFRHHLFRSVPIHRSFWVPPISCRKDVTPGRTVYRGKADTTGGSSGAPGVAANV